MDFIESANKIYLNPIIELIKNSLFIVILIIVVFYFLRYLLNDVCDKYNKWEQKIKKADESDNTNWECLLISGPWGSGKTTYYKNNYKYVKYKNKSSQPNIYISCFGSSRAELVAQIIRQQFWCNLFTLHGFLGKLVENNWQSFMPKNRVVVFDDLERLHSGKDNYQDLIAVIDYLKVAKECKIILICNLSELRGEGAKIFNMYMERVVDYDIVLEKLDKLKFDQIFDPDLKIKAPKIARQLKENLFYLYCNSDMFLNLRIIKNSYTQILFNIEAHYDKHSEILSLIFVDEIKNHCGWFNLSFHPQVMKQIDQNIEDLSFVNNARNPREMTIDERTKIANNNAILLNHFYLTENVYSRYKDQNKEKYKLTYDISYALLECFISLQFLNRDFQGINNQLNIIINNIKENNTPPDNPSVPIKAEDYLKQLDKEFKKSFNISEQQVSDFELWQNRIIEFCKEYMDEQVLDNIIQTYLNFDQHYITEEKSIDDKKFLMAKLGYLFYWLSLFDDDSKWTKKVLGKIKAEYIILMLGLINDQKGLINISLFPLPYNIGPSFVYTRCYYWFITFDKNNSITSLVKDKYIKVFDNIKLIMKEQENNDTTT